MKFLVAYKKGKKNLLKIELDDGEQVWASTTSAVYNFAKNNFDEGEKAGFEYTVKNGQYFVSRINKDGKSTKSEEEPVEDTPAEFVCEDCGKTLKDGKYKKCYTCNKKNPSPKSTSTRSSDTNESIKKQCALKATVHLMQVLVGRVEGIDTLVEMVEEAFPRIYDLIK